MRRLGSLRGTGYLLVDGFRLAGRMASSPTATSLRRPPQGAPGGAGGQRAASGRPAIIRESPATK